MNHTQNNWRTVKIPTGLMKQVEKHVAQKDCTSPNKSDFIRGAVEKELKECTH